jgi:hypothetical protein
MMCKEAVMKRVLLGLLACILIAGCGGGSAKKDYTVVLPTPLHEALLPVAESLTLTLRMRDEEIVADSIIASADGAFSEGRSGYVFELNDMQSLSDIAEADIIFVLPEDYAFAKSEILPKVTVARVLVPFVPTGDVIVLSVADEDYDFLIDDDNDGLSNIAEFAASLNPLVADTDGDGVLDGVDVCPLASNADQGDADGDGVGDACDDDYVASSISPTLDDDRDDDGVLNDDDNCPDSANRDQADVDGDGNGDVCDNDIDGDGVENGADNCPYVSNPAQSKDDFDGDEAFDDCDLDSTDPKVGTAQGGMFVDIAHGDDASFGTKEHPLASLQAGIMKARAQGKSVYVAAGTYPLSGVAFYDDVNVFGGFKNAEEAAERFAQRVVHSDDPQFLTKLTNDGEDVTLRLESVSLTLSGFSITNVAETVSETCGSRTVVVGNGADVSLERNSIEGNSTAFLSTGVVAEFGGNLNLHRNFVDGGGADNPTSSSIGMKIDDANATLTNNIIRGGLARFVTGLDVKDASPIIVNNTIDAIGGASNLGGGEAVRLDYANPVFVNNLVFTGESKTQYALTCYGDIDDAAEFRNNLFAAFPGDVGHPLVVDCDTIAYIACDPFDFQMGDAAVDTNLTYNASNDPQNLVDRNGSYALVSEGIDDGIDASGEEYGKVTEDFNGTSRTGSYDIGAVEN